MSDPLVETTPPMEFVDALEKLLEIMPWTPWLVGIVVSGLYVRLVIVPAIHAWRRK